ncbi:MAG: hypothetical protein PHP50_14195 [Lachnospiraceae bacterium]|nr:hypothetical protein [Lachnospiraceae bacterium]
MNILPKNKNACKEILAVTGLIMLSMALLIRTFYGMDWTDEAMYLSDAYRLYQGDMFLAENWFLAQTSSIILLPFVTLYCSLWGTSGIILFFRILYLIFQMALAIRVYFFVKKYFPVPYSHIVAFGSAFTYLFYTKCNIATLSYNTISLGCLVYASMLIYMVYQEFGKVRCIGVGILLSLATLCNPYLAIFYIVVSFGILFVSNNSWKRIWVYLTIGITFTVMIVLIWTLINSSLSAILNNLHFILSDPGHPPKALGDGFVTFFAQFERFGIMEMKRITLLLILSLGWHFLRKKFSTKINVTVNLLIWIVFLYCIISKCWETDTQLGTIFLALIGIETFILGRSNRYSIFIVIGFIFAIATTFASDTGLTGVASSAVVICIVTLPMLAEFLEGQYRQLRDVHYIRILSSVVIAYIVLMLGTVYISGLNYRFEYVYKESHLKDQIIQIENGPAKYLYTKREDKEIYDNLYNLIREEIDPDTDSVFISYCGSMLYLFTEARNAAPTAWKINVSSARLEQYYKQFPNRFPSKVLLIKNTIEPLVGREPNDEGWIIEQLQERGYNKEDFEFMTIYEK